MPLALPRGEDFLQQHSPLGETPIGRGGDA